MHTPDLDAQRAAMKKLAFLVGKWSGEVRMFRGPGEPAVIAQTEEVQYKLDGLVLLIEGVGRASGGPALQALGVVSYDDETGTYPMRAFNDGRFLETEGSAAWELCDRPGSSGKSVRKRRCRGRESSLSPRTA
jgi:uncharacterized protein DUF1579